ncbi:MAG TPA: chemotaxis protein CheW [Chloroflexota bacterium]|nr:chemotaxis protein CheW [Chloroflexota bacterium]
MSPQEVFAHRAAQLSRPIETATEGREQLVVFRLGGERYGCAPRVVQELVEVASRTVVPGAPEWMLGLINLRGRVCSLVDVRPILELPAEPLAGRELALVLSHPTMAVAILVEALEGMLGYAPEDVHSAVTHAAGASGHPFQGQLLAGGGLVTILDLEQLVNEETLTVDHSKEAGS